MREYSYLFALCTFHCLHTGSDNIHHCLKRTKMRRSILWFVCRFWLLKVDACIMLVKRYFAIELPTKDFCKKASLLLCTLIKELTDGAVLSFIASRESASVVVHSFNTRSIVFTWAGITVVISIWCDSKIPNFRRLNQLYSLVRPLFKILHNATDTSTKFLAQGNAWYK